MAAKKKATNKAMKEPVRGNDMYSYLALIIVLAALAFAVFYLAKQNVFSSGKTTSYTNSNEMMTGSETGEKMEDQSDLDSAIEEVESVNADDVMKGVDQNEKDLLN